MTHPYSDEPTPEDWLAALHQVAAELSRVNGTLRLLALLILIGIAVAFFL